MSESFTEEAEFWSRKERERRGLDVDRVGALLAKSDTPWTDMGCDQPTGMSRFTTDLEEHDCAYMPIEIRDGTRVICKVYQDDAPLHDYNREQTAYARRIVACLNACEGLDTEGLENLTAIGETIASMHDRATSGQLRAMTQARLATAQRDDLLAALRRCRDMVGHPDNIAEIDAAIAKIEGKKGGAG